MKPLLVIMAKAPVAGRIKTRLAAEIGAIEALRFYRAFSSAVVRRLSADTRWETAIAVSPDYAIVHPCWPLHIRRIAQGSGDLGARMQRIFDEHPGRRTIIVGTDIPGISSAHIARGFTALGRKPAVLGPAPDGGYWLVGCRGTPRIADFFSDVRWSSPETLNDTITNLGRENVALVDELEDVDEVADYRKWKERAGRIV